MKRRDFLGSGFAALAMATGGCMNMAPLKDADNDTPVFKAREFVKLLNDGGKVYCFSNRSYEQMLSTVFVSPEGRVLVVDGGSFPDGMFLGKFLRSIGGKVDYWFITHAHRDHYGALVMLAETGALNDIEVGELIFNFPERDWLEASEPPCKPSIARWSAFLSSPVGKRITRGDCAPGRKVKFGSWEFCILNTPLQVAADSINNSSVCLTVRAGGKSWLVTGDISVDGGRRLLGILGDNARHDIVFMAHHGQCGVDKAFYAAIAPEVAVWPTPDWLWDNCLKDATPGSGPYRTNFTKCWMQELGVKRQYVVKHDVIFE